MINDGDKPDPPVYGPKLPPTVAAPGKSDASTGKSSSNATKIKENEEVLVKAPPDEMEGIKGLWKIAFDCDDESVGKSTIKLLLQLHSEVDFGEDGREQKDQVSKYEDQFIESCFKMIKADMVD